MVFWETITGVAYVIGISLTIIMVTVAIVYFTLKELRYRDQVIIIDKTATGGIAFETTRGGAFIDPKTKNKLYFLKKYKFGLSPDHAKYVNWNKKKATWVVKYGINSFAWATPELIGEAKLQIVAGEEDINNALNTYDRNKKLFTQTTFMQLMPYFALAFVGIVMMVLFIQLFKQFDVLQVVSDNLLQVAETLKEAKATTIVVPGGG